IQGRRTSAPTDPAGMPPRKETKAHHRGKRARHAAPAIPREVEPVSAFVNDQTLAEIARPLSRARTGYTWNAEFDGGGDMAIVSIISMIGVPSWNPKPWVYVTPGPDTTLNTQYAIQSDSTSLWGMRICASGAAYGRSSCGYVTALDVTVSYG